MLNCISPHSYIFKNKLSFSFLYDFVTAPRIVNVQRAVEHIYPLVVKFRMDRCKEELMEVHSSSAVKQQFSLQQPWSLQRPNDWCPKAEDPRVLIMGVVPLVEISLTMKDGVVKDGFSQICYWISLLWRVTIN